jgi:peroxiredoxin
LWQDYRARGVQVLVIDVKESEEDTRRYAERWGFSFPVLRDSDGEATARFAPAEVLPELNRSDVPIASNLIIDGEGVIRFYTLLDTNSFDAKLIGLRARLEELLTAPAPGGAPDEPYREENR